MAAAVSMSVWSLTQRLLSVRLHAVQETRLFSLSALLVYLSGLPVKTVLKRFPFLDCMMLLSLLYSSPVYSGENIKRFCTNILILHHSPNSMFVTYWQIGTAVNPGFTVFTAFNFLLDFLRFDVHLWNDTLMIFLCCMFCSKSVVL